MAWMSPLELDRALVDECYTAIDLVRGNQGKAPLQRTPEMEMHAGSHAQWMAQHNVFVPSPQVFRPGQRENLWKGIGVSPFAMVQAAVRDWLARQGQAETLLADDLERIGVGLYTRDVIEQQRHFLALVVRTGRN